MMLGDCVEYCKYLKVALDLFGKVGLTPDHLKGIKVWIGASRHDTTSVKMRNLYTCVLGQLGVEVLDHDFDAILNERVQYDVILMFTLTPGTSARAIEVVLTSSFCKTLAKDKLYVCMPREYGDGYISRKLGQHLVAGKLYLKEKIGFEQLDEKVLVKCVAHLIDIANYKRKQMEITFKPTVAILTALPKEFDMVRRLLTAERFDKSFGDSASQYPHGRIGGKNVVVAMSGVGNNLSSAIAMKLYERYPSIKYTFVVVIAGGIPDYTDKNNHVRLGDIVS